MDIYGQRLPPSVIKKVYLPAQYNSKEEAQTFQSIGNTISDTTIAVSASSAGNSVIM